MPEPQDSNQTVAKVSRQGWLAYENQLVGVLTLTFGIVMIDRLALNFLAPFVKSDLKLSNGQIGLLASGLALTWAVSGVVITRICDRIGRQRIALFLAVVCFSACSFLSGLAATFGVLLATRLLMGIAEGPVLPIAHSLLARESSPHRRGLNMGAMQLLGSNILGSFLAPLVIVYVAEIWGWRRAFFVAGIPGLLCALLLWFVVRDPQRSGSGVPAAPINELWKIMRSRNIVLCMLISGLMVAWSLLSFVFLPLYFTKVSGISPRAMSLLMSLMGVSAVVASVVVSGLSDRVGRKPVVMGFALLGLLIPLGIPLVTPSLAMLAILILAGFLAAGIAPIAMATIPAETAPGPDAATIVGLVIGFAEIFAALFGPLLGGVIADRYGLPAILWLQLALIIAVIVIACFLRETFPGPSRTLPSIPAVAAH